MALLTTLAFLLILTVLEKGEDPRLLMAALQRRGF